MYPVRKSAARATALGAILVALSTFVLLAPACCGLGSSTEEWIDVQARVQCSGTQFVITNQDGFDWNDAEFEINDTYTLRITRVPAGGKVSLNLRDFTKADGTRFNPFTAKVLNLTLVCKCPKGTGFGSWDPQ